MSGIIEAIDHALYDWDVGPDAMRWAPEPVKVASPRLRPVVVTIEPDSAAWNAVMERAGRLVVDMAEAIQRAAEQMGKSLAVMAEDIRAAGVVRPVPPSDPRARALFLRQRRGTGPSTDVTRQRRPRTHTLR